MKFKRRTEAACPNCGKYNAVKEDMRQAYRNEKGGEFGMPLGTRSSYCPNCKVGYKVKGPEQEAIG
jgi:hypothetical protein